MISVTLANGVARGKIILMGEHAVVYGAPAIAMPFTAAKTHVRISAHPEQHMLDCALYQGPLASAPTQLRTLQEVVRMVTTLVKQPQAFVTIRIASTIPTERGMGSSAAVAVALVRALFHYFGIQPHDEQVLSLARVAETISHGQSSGLDATVITYQQSLYYQKGCADVPITVAMDAYLVVADSGQVGQTKQAVQRVAERRAAQPRITEALETLGNLTVVAADAIKNNQPALLGECFTHAHQLLRYIGVSTVKLDQLVQVAINNGALGAKLTGGGLGGCMIALADTPQRAEQLSEALYRAGAQQVWIQPLTGIE